MVLERQAKIQNKLGLHARAASVFVQKAQGFSSQISVRNSNTSADGKSIMNMMMLQASIGSEITIKIDGDDQEQAMIAILALIDDKFGEGE